MKKIFIIIVMILCNISIVSATGISKDITGLKESKIGIGGGGALFEPTISPFNSNEMFVVPDMGGIYISHNQGDNWNRVNLYGTVYTAEYDPNREGTLYAGGSGLYRSTDNGDTFELIFPKENDIIAKRLHNGNSLQYYFTYSGIYDRNVPIKDILIDPDDSNHIFALGYYSKKGIVYESIDNGENFKVLFNYTTNRSATLQFDFNELVYKRETKELFVMNKDGIIGYNKDTKEKYTVYNSEYSLVDVSTVYENDKTYFVILEKVENKANVDTIIYYTDDFVNRVDLTDKIVNDLDEYIQNNYHNNAISEVGTGYFINKGTRVEFKFNFNYVAASSLSNIYISNLSYSDNYKYSIDGIIHYKNGETKYLYGNPFYDHNHLTTRAWNDGCTYALGLNVNSLNDEQYVFTTLNGIYYGTDDTHLYPRWTTVTEGKYPNAKYVTNGLDEQRTYAVYEDPFNKGHLLLLNTDLGLIRSEDNGASWVRSNSGVSKWENTIYDAHYDKKHEGVVYGLWSNRHNAPLNGGNETDGKYGVFAISRNGGATWDPTYSSGLPENAIPVKMTVLYPEDRDELTIYLATFNCGFYVSYDSGKTFIEMNNGIERIKYQNKEDSRYHYIYAQDIEVTDDGRIFGLTTRNDVSGANNPGKLYEYINEEWVNIPLPTNANDPTDIIYHKGILYISLFAKSIWDGKNGASWNLYGGGVLTYKDGEITQIFDESIFVTSVVFDSHDTMYISDIEGNIYRKELGKEIIKIYEDYHYRSESLQITDDDDVLYLSTHGGGMLKLEGLNNLYKTNTLPGDFNNNGRIDLSDVLTLLKLYFDNSYIDDMKLKIGDINGNKKIDLPDVLLLLKVYFNS